MQRDRVSRTLGGVLALCATLALVSATALAGDQRTADEAKAKTKATEPDPRILSAADIQAALAPHEAAISRCYRDNALTDPKATGDLKIELIIRRDGTVMRTWVFTQGTKPDKTTRCIEKLTQAWRFPHRKGFTHALVPFFFLRTVAKGAGPQRSCWNPNGCPQKRATQRAEAK